MVDDFQSDDESTFLGVFGREPSLKERLREATFRDDSDIKVEVEALCSEAMDDARCGEDDRRVNAIPKKLYNPNFRLVDEGVSDRGG